MTHNDRLAVTLQGAIRLYGLVATPSPTFTLFYDVDLIITWYAAILLQEMGATVDTVLVYWRKPSNNASGYAHKYKYPLPWIPMRLGEGSGLFLTRIPEDVKARLEIYLEYARLKESSVSPTFKASVAKLDEKVVLSYMNSLQILVATYSAALMGKDWSDSDPESLAGTSLISPHREEEEARQLDEHLEWLCSVADDCYRIYATDINKLSGFSESYFARHRLYEQAMDCEWDALDQISCALFRVCIADDGKLLDESLHKKWLPPTALIGRNDSEVEPFTNHLKCLIELINQRSDHLEPRVFQQLVAVCAGKVTSRYLHMLRGAQKAGRSFSSTGPELSLLRLHVELVWSKFLKLVGAEDEESLKIIRPALRPLDLAQALLLRDSESHEFSESLQSVLKTTKYCPSHAASLKAFVETCVALRGDTQHFRMKKQTTNTFSLGLSLSMNTSIDEQGQVLIPELNGFRETMHLLAATKLDQDSDTTIVRSHTITASIITRVFAAGSDRHSLEQILLTPTNLLPAVVNKKGQSTRRLPSFSSFFRTSKRRGNTASMRLEQTSSAGYRSNVSIVKVSGLSGVNIDGEMSGSTNSSNNMTRYSSSRAKCYLSLEVGDIRHKTSIKGCGALVSWSGEEFLFEVPSDALTTSRLGCNVLVKGTVYGRYHWATMSLSLDKLEVAPIEDQVCPLDMSIDQRSVSGKSEVQDHQLPAIRLTARLLRR
jgi:hypothetical protein